MTTTVVESFWIVSSSLSIGEYLHACGCVQSSLLCWSFGQSVDRVLSFLCRALTECEVAVPCVLTIHADIYRERERKIDDSCHTYECVMSHI